MPGVGAPPGELFREALKGPKTMQVHSRQDVTISTTMYTVTGETNTVLIGFRACSTREAQVQYHKPGQTQELGRQLF